MQHLFVLSELFVRLTPLCALIGSFVMCSEQLKLKTLLISQIVTVACAAIGMTLFLVTQPLYTPDPATIWHGLVKFDFLASVMATSISLITLIVVWFSERNLLGDKTRSMFIQHLMALSLVASVLVAANDIVLFLICWNAISILLWRTIGLKKDAASSSRIVLFHHLFSDVCFLLAVILVANACHATAIPSIVSNRGSLQGGFVVHGWSAPFATSTLVGLLLLVAMGCKSALFPFHKWLLATIDAPTPLSGLLHAGIVNVSAIMAARLYPVLIQSTSVHVLWLVWSVSAAFIGTLCMSTRSDTKGELVFSTVGQMGFMSLEGGVGAIAAAIFHLIAHGFFKCLLFLQAHSSISEGLLKMRYGHALGGVDRVRSKLHLGYMCLLAVPVLDWLCMQESVDSAASLSVLFVMGALIMSVEAFKRIGLGLLLAATLTFLGAVVLAGDLSKFSAYYMEPAPLHSDWFLVASIVAFGVATYWLSQVRGASLGKALYVHALNGLYMDELGDIFRGSGRRVARIFILKRSSNGRRKTSAKAGC
ncbi:MAG: proton-conducting transporter membrane subunit [Candidatus Obscuribacterales bacterium]|nr:proton-conducting transporter membrane subunit [Candidatus Obscuribacterales bacterium]